MVYSKEKYQELKRQGICVLCGVESAVEGRVSCQRCADKQKLHRSLKYRQERQRLRAERMQKSKEKWHGCEETCPDYCPYSDCLKPYQDLVYTNGYKSPIIVRRPREDTD